MTQHHVPDLEAIRNLPNSEIRFYAAIGAAISLAAGLELRFLDIFQKATGLDRELAVHIVYSNRNTMYQRDAADQAMQHKLRNAPVLLSIWTAINSRIVAATGNRGARNLVGHTAVTKTSRSFGGGIGGGPIGAAPIGGSIIEVSYSVEQDRDKILAGIQKPRKEDFDSLLAYCAELISLIDDIDNFLNQI